MDILRDYPNVLNVSDIQDILEIGRRQAYDLVNSGQFHVVRVGSRIKVSKLIFLKWLNGEGDCDKISI